MASDANAALSQEIAALRQRLQTAEGLLRARRRAPRATSPEVDAAIVAIATEATPHRWRRPRPQETVAPPEEEAEAAPEEEAEDGSQDEAEERQGGPPGLPEPDDEGAEVESRAGSHTDAVSAISGTSQAREVLQIARSMRTEAKRAFEEALQAGRSVDAAAELAAEAAAWVPHAIPGEEWRIAIGLAADAAQPSKQQLPPPTMQRSTREAERITIPPLPRPDEYRGWRLSVEAAVRAAARAPREAGRWFDEVGHKGISGLRAGPPEMESLDSKLYAALLAQMKGETGKRIVQAIVQHGEVGNGRQALKCVDEDYAFETARSAQVTVSDFLTLNCTGGISGLEKFLVTWDDLLHRLRGTPDAPSENMRCFWILVSRLQREQG